MNEIPDSIVVSTGDGTTAVACKQMGENIVPKGCFYDEGERYNALLELLQSSVFPLFYKLNERIKSLFQCEQDNISYTFSLYKDPPRRLTLSQGMRLVIEKLKYNPSDDFNLYVNIDCTLERSRKHQELGTQIWVAYGVEPWYYEDLDENYPVWLLYIEKEQTVLESLFSKSQIETIISNIIRRLFSNYNHVFDLNANNQPIEIEISPRQKTEEWSDKLSTLFLFLKENRSYNALFQYSEFRKILLQYSNPFEKLIALLYHIYNTQSQPGLDNLAAFMEKFYPYSRISSFEGFIKLLTKNEIESFPLTFEGLFRCMRIQPGWGDKTAALFTKAIYKIHTSESMTNLRFWNDLPALDTNDKLFLPVDAVIQKIFDEITYGKLKGFAGINQYLQSRYSPEEIEIWDDLWFWGFITQRSNGKGEREDDFNFNKSKYWSLMAVSKDSDAINEIRSLSNEFIAIISSCYE